MDIATNHYNTRGAPTGYMAMAAGMPLPWSPSHKGMNQKIHFLAYCYHLTGDRRAKEVMEEVIAGTKKAYQASPSHPHNRQLNTMNAFFAHAYEETWDPELKALARSTLDETLNVPYVSGRLADWFVPEE
jgi:hypothetical protein